MDGDNRVTIQEFRARVAGDPHLVLFSGATGDYHGQCDLVLMSGGVLDDGMPLKIHIRTSIVTDWSFIKTAVIQIGTDRLEIFNQDAADHVYNGVQGAPLSTMGGGKYAVTYAKPFYTIDLGSGQTIVIKNRKLISVSINNPQEHTFGNAVGLLGDFTTGNKLSRDGQIIEDWNDFGSEWQVQGDVDEMLFSTTEGPQYPEEACRMPDPKVAMAQRKRRRLRGLSRKLAEAACANTVVDPTDLEFCITDVLLTGDVDMANEY